MGEVEENNEIIVRRAFSFHHRMMGYIRGSQSLGCDPLESCETIFRMHFSFLLRWLRQIMTVSSGHATAPQTSYTPVDSLWTTQINTWGFKPRLLFFKMKTNRPKTRQRGQQRIQQRRTALRKVIDIWLRWMYWRLYTCVKRLSRHWHMLHISTDRL